MRLFVLFLLAMIGLSCAKEEPFPVEKVLGTWKQFISLRTWPDRVDCYYRHTLELKPETMVQTVIIEPHSPQPIHPRCDEVLLEEKQQYEFSLRGRAEGRRFLVDEILFGEGKTSDYARRKGYVSYEGDEDRSRLYLIGDWGHWIYGGRTVFSYYPGSYGESDSPVSDESGTVTEEAL